jgi:hypothetical protein
VAAAPRPRATESRYDDVHPDMKGTISAT